VITIDGSAGEGGGQILRTALALATVTGKPFRIEKIRAGRPKPGLLRQHLTAVRAAAKISGATITGAELGSGTVTFSPGRITTGDFHFAVGTAGSATLVLQTVLPALMTANAPSKLMLEGGTHNPAAPPFDFLTKSFLPLINRMGPKVSAVLECPGFYPAGGGRFTVSIDPVPRVLPIEMIERGAIPSIRAHILIANLPRSIAEREVKVLSRLLAIPEDSLTVEVIRSAEGPGNVAMVEIETEDHAEVFTGFGEIAVRAEAVATKVAQEARAYITSGVPIGKYLTDQLLIPMALSGSGTFRTGPLSLHATTNLEVIRQFLEVDIKLGEDPKRAWTIRFG